MAFEHRTLGQRVVFRTGGSAQAVAEEVLRQAASRVLVVAAAADRALAEEACALIEPAGWFTDVVQHVPVEVAESARATASQIGADLVVSVGGGSTTGLAKAIALTADLPVVAVPTTYAGSEATNVWGLTERRAKTTGADDKVLPRTVIYDADLTLSLPRDLSVSSGLNGLAHCIDSLWAPRADPINEALAIGGANALARALRGLVQDPTDVDAREAALYGCYLAAVAFTSAGSGLHHKICHVLGGSFNLPHAATHAVVLPHVLAMNAPYVPAVSSRLVTALDGAAESRTDSIGALADLYREIDAPSSLADLGFAAADVPEAVERCLAAAPPSNPVPVTAENLTCLLHAARTGAPTIPS